jgi:dephospho-CoA kinase
MEDSDRLLNKYIGLINVQPKNTKRLFAIGLIGTIGVGKSTVSQEIAKRLGIFVASNDAIRRFLNGEGIPGVSPDQALVQRIAEESSRYLFDKEVSHVIDADLMRFYDVARKNVEGYGAKFYLIHLVCPEEIVLAHLRERDQKIQELMKTGEGGEMKSVGHSLSSVDDHMKSVKLHEEIPMPDNIFMTIDTSLPIERQLDELENKLKKEGVI